MNANTDNALTHFRHFSNRSSGKKCKVNNPVNNIAKLEKKMLDFLASRRANNYMARYGPAGATLEPN